ncbi:MAG TPA: hypothetical protein VJM83_02470 [Nitrospirota bacterium]|nr:hypothetical protein [Nitrospirota bacterium]
MLTKENGNGLGIFRPGSHSAAIDAIIVSADAAGITHAEIIAELRRMKATSRNLEQRVRDHIRNYGIKVGIYEEVDGRVKMTKNAAEIAEKIKDIGITKYRWG